VTLAARMLLALNRVFPQPIDYKGTSTDAYSQWEHDTGRDMFERFFSRHVAVGGRRLLDVGCGAGGKTVFYSGLGPERLIAIDILEKNAAQAKSYATSHDAEAEYAIADAAKLPFAADTFDIITATDTFEHFADPLAALREMARVLRPGGDVLFNFPPYRSPLGSHLYDVIHLPWCHLLASEPVLFEAIELAFVREEREKGVHDPSEAAKTRADKMREYYRKDLNRMTIKRFLSLVEEVPDMALVWMHRKPLKTRLLAPLTRVPPFDELTTTLAIGVLKKLS